MKKVIVSLVSFVVLTAGVAAFAAVGYDKKLFDFCAGGNNPGSNLGKCEVPSTDARPMGTISSLVVNEYEPASSTTTIYLCVQPFDSNTLTCDPAHFFANTGSAGFKSHTLPVPANSVWKGAAFQTPYFFYINSAGGLGGISFVSWEVDY
jgi:hypothetical protein